MKKLLLLLTFVIGLAFASSASSDEKACIPQKEPVSHCDAAILFVASAPMAFDAWIVVLEYPPSPSEIAKSSKHTIQLIKPPTHQIFNPIAYSMAYRCV